MTCLARVPPQSARMPRRRRWFIPDRFGFLMRVGPFDPGLEGWIEDARASPICGALRTVAFGPERGRTPSPTAASTGCSPPQNE